MKKLAEYYSSLNPEAQFVISICVFFLFICWYCCVVLLSQIDNSESDEPDLDSLIEELVNEERAKGGDDESK